MPDRISVSISNKYQIFFLNLLVYRHADIDRIHFHIVSTRIDRQSGKKIKDNFEKEKVQKFIKEMEQTYQLKNNEPKEKINLKFTAYSKNLKQNLENLFTELNRMDFIASKQMYNDALKLFHIEIRQGLISISELFHQIVKLSSYSLFSYSDHIIYGWIK